MTSLTSRDKRTKPSRRARRLLLVTAGALCLPAWAASAAGAQDFIGAPSGVAPQHGTVQPGAPAPSRSPSPHGFAPLITPAITCPALDASNNPTPSPACNMTYHAGSVMITNHTHIVYWQPAGFSTSTNYHSLTERYLTDVAADSGRVTNPYAVDTQYTDSTTAHIQYGSTYAGATTDTTAYPAAVAGCNNQNGSTVCLTSTQQVTELDNFIQANSLPRGINELYFMVLPEKVQTCFDDFTDCGPYGGITDSKGNFSEYCAYHSSFNISSHGLTLWANMPDGADGGCNVVNSPPNGDGADTLIDSLSHEHNETITNPQGGGWFDATGSGENGDKCNFTFGPDLASTPTGGYDVLINHHPYQIQPEWDNTITGCSMTFGAVAPTAAFTFSPTSPLALQNVSFDGSTSASNDTGGYIIDYSWDFGDSSPAGSGATPTHAYSASGSYTVTLTVKDDAGKTSTTTHTVVVAKIPTTTTVTSNHAPSVFGQPVTFTATVAPSDGGGTVGFTADGTPIPGCGAKSLTGASPYQATCTISSLSVAGSPHAIIATYTGDAAYQGSTSATFSQTVNKAATTTTVTAAPASPSNFGTPVTFTATVAATPPGAGTPTGTAAFTVDGTPVGTVPLTGGSASITTASLSAGTHTIAATYSGDGSFFGSTGSLPYTVTCSVTITGTRSGSLEVTGSTCVKPGGVVNGSIVVHAGGALDLEGAVVNGAISANGTSGLIRICSTQVASSVDIKNATGLVIVGDPGDAACPSNRIGGILSLQNNSGGVEAIGNTVAGAIITSGNSGPGPFPGDVTTISGNHH